LGGPSWQQLLLPDSTPNPAAEESLFDSFENLLRVRDPDNVWAPAVELGGHEQHNLVGSVAREVFGPAYRPYFTYVRGQMRTRGDEVPYEPSWVVAKMRALCCYVSQIALENTRPWFVDDTLREFRP
jgi:LmbE family N-acetylglucosaminyl deacetylase